VATSGLLYELALGTLATYFLGNAVTQFSIVLGVYLSSMGVGSFASSRVGGLLTARFVEIETAVAFVGGTSAAFLFYAFTRLPLFRPILYAEVFVIGALVGLELPILLRLLREDMGFHQSVVRGLTFDYVGSLVASLLFPLVLVPTLGLVRTAAVSGIVNAGVASFGATLVPAGRGRGLHFAAAVATGAALLVLVVLGGDVARATAD